MSETFYRLHSNPDAPCFCASHAWSGLWGGTWNADGSANECRECDGTGIPLLAPDGRCDNCDEGWEPATYGYSCCWSAAELVEYMTKHGMASGDDKVVIFEGRKVGTGFDGEPLAVPTGDVKWITWAELAQQTKEK